MTFLTKLWGKVGAGALEGSKKQFSKLPALEPAVPVGLVPLEKAWGIPGTNVLIAHDLPKSIVPLSDHLAQSVLHEMLRVMPNTEHKTRWDRDTATRELTSFLGQGHVELWDDWETDEGWLRMFVQGPCAGDLRREGDVYVVDAGVLALGPMRPGCAELGVKVAVTIDEAGVHPAWIRKQDGTIVEPGDPRWAVTRVIAAAGLHNYVGMVRHVLNLHYVGAQALAVLVHNHLPFDHPLHRLLWPHVAGTLAVNWTATTNFVGPHALGVQNYAPTWEAWKKLIPAGWAAFAWEDYDIPETFARRGTDALIAKGLYPFGEDATLIWGVIRGYVDDYLAQYYANDAAVAEDVVVQEALTGLDPVVPQPLRAETRGELAQILTRFISMVSLEHKLVSGIAWDYMTHPYYFPNLAREADTVEDAVPFREEAEANVMFRYTISAMAWPLLGDWTYVMLDDKGRGAMKRFHEALRAAGKVIDERNEKRKWPFPHLHPDGLETSVAV